jgi:D-arginine dehydrogenase
VAAPDGRTVDAWPSVFDIDERFYFKPDATRLLISPADEEPHPPWAGLRTFAPDRGPVSGFDARVPGLFWCAGQGGYGIQSAPACAQLAAALARREPVPQAIAAEGVTAQAVSPARFSPHMTAWRADS